MAIRIEDITKRLLDEAVDGIGLFLGRKAVEYAKPYTKKTLREWNDAVIKIGISLVDFVVPQVRQVPYLGDWLTLWGRDGVSDVLKVLVDKPADCWAVDANTIRCINFDVLPKYVAIDGVEKAKDTDYAVSGTPDEFDINLVSALTAGAHDLVVTGLRKSFSGKIHV